MMSVGCIQAQRCHTNRCPVGVTTQDPKLQRALDVPDKSERVHHFHRNTVHAVAEMIAAMGLDHPTELRPEQVYGRGGGRVMTFPEMYDFPAAGRPPRRHRREAAAGLLGRRLARQLPTAGGGGRARLMIAAARRPTAVADSGARVCADGRRLRRSQRAERHARGRSAREQLVSSAKSAGVAPHLTVGVAESMYGSTAPGVCKVFDDGLSTAEKNDLLGNPSGRRPKSITTDAVTYGRLVVQAYCPQQLAHYNAAVKDLDPLTSSG